MTIYETSMHQMVAHCKADVNLAVAACKLIEMAPQNEQVDLFVQFMYEFRYTKSDHTSSVYEEFPDDCAKDLSKAKMLIKRFLDNNNNNGLSEYDYHNAVWDYICKESNNDKRKKARLMVACSLNKNLPYIDRNKAMTMTQEQFNEEIASIDPISTAKIRHIANADFTQITEDASMFMPILEKGKDTHEKALLLSLILIAFQSKMIPSSLSDLLDDDE